VFNVLRLRGIEIKKKENNKEGEIKSKTGGMGSLKEEKY